MIEELKRYEKKIRGESEPVYDHRMFVQNQKRVYQQMDGIENINNEKPNAEESKHFRSNIWDNEKEHERNAEWFRAEKDDMKQKDINITTELIKEQVKKIPN